MQNMLRNLPTVSELLDNPSLRPLVQRVSRSVVVSRARRFLDDMQAQLRTTAANVQFPTPAELAQRIADWIASEEQPGTVPVINATGVLLPPDLGRAPLAEEAISAMAATSQGYANVEINLMTGEIAERTLVVERLITRLTGTEAAAVVNNKAAAMLVTLAGLAKGREVIVSRGHLVEDDGYRLPEMFTASGAMLREVGTANKTRTGDYAAAIGPQTAAILHVHTGSRVHPSDHEEAPLAELVALARKNDLPLIEDLSSGALLDLSKLGVTGEPTVAQQVNAGVDVVMFSGDKLLGGPQCGLIVGRAPLIERITRHTLTRALRASKLTLAALAATLRLYEDADLAERLVPILSLLSTPLENLRLRAERLAPQLSSGGMVHVEIVPGQATIGTGALAQHAVPSICLALTPQTGTAASLAAMLRRGCPPVIGRTEAGRVLLDMRTVSPRDDVQIVAAVDALKPRQAETPSGQQTPAAL